MEGALKVGTTPGGLGGFRLGDPWRGLWRQAELELVQQELVVLLRLGVAGEDERAPVRGWKVNVQHLDGGELLKYGAGREPRRQRAQALFQRHLKAIGEEGHEDVRLDALVRLMIDGPDGEIALQLLERLLHFGELDVEGPQLRRGLSYEIGAQQIPAFVSPAGAQARPVQRKGESLRGDGLTGLGQFDGNEARGAARLFLGAADFEQQLVTGRCLAT